jgi:uncharacterized OB-fold protein
MPATCSCTDFEAAFVQGLSQGLLRYQRCGQCNRAQSLVRHACEHCGARLSGWQDSCGAGWVRACSTVYRAPSEQFKPLLPYALVLVELCEGFRLMGHAEPGTGLGDEVQARFFRHQERMLVRFAPLVLPTRPPALLPIAPETLR